MIWAILALLGVPLWLCALAIFGLVLRNRSLRKRPGNIPVRVRRPGKQRWLRGHAVWISDVFAWRASPAAWSEGLVHVRSVFLHAPDAGLAKKLRRVGPDPVLATLSLAGGDSLDVAAAGEHRAALLGPFAATAGAGNEGAG
jgi:hypothetical protein